MPNNTEEKPLSLSALMLLVLTALLSSHAMDVGRLLIVVWDMFVQGEPGQEKFRVEGGLLVAGVGLVILAVFGARNALRDGGTKEINVVLAVLVTGLLGLAFSILDKTADDNGLPTPDTANGLIFVVIGGCVLLPPYFAMPSTSARFRKATGTLLRVGTAGLITFVLGLLVQAVYLGMASVCADPCGDLETGKLKLGDPAFFISAPSAGAFAAAMAVLATDPIVQKDQWDRFGAWRRGLWLGGMLLVGVVLSALYAIGSYYPKHGEMPTDGVLRDGWMRQVQGAELDRPDAVLMLALLHMPALLAAVLALMTGPAWPRGVSATVRTTALLAGAALVGGIGAFGVTVLVAGTEQLQGKEPYFVAAHGATAVAVMVGACVAIGRGRRAAPATNAAIGADTLDHPTRGQAVARTTRERTDTTLTKRGNESEAGE
jgi:hypothetical protein